MAKCTVIFGVTWSRLEDMDSRIRAECVSPSNLCQCLNKHNKLSFFFLSFERIFRVFISVRFSCLDCYQFHSVVLTVFARLLLPVGQWKLLLWEWSLWFGRLGVAYAAQPLASVLDPGRVLDKKALEGPAFCTINDPQPA